MANLIGQTVAGYPIEKPLEQGAYTTLYQAQTSAEPVAVHVLRDDLRGDAALNAAVAAGWEKARATVHANLVAILATGSDPEHGAYCLQEIVKARTLRKIVVDGMKLTWRDGLEFAAQIASGLEALHAAGLVHGQLWPGSVLITLDQDVKLEAAGGLAEPPRPVAQLLNGAALGYIAPERLRGAHAMPAADLFALGGCLYYLYAGRDPYVLRDSAAIVKAVCEQDPLPLKEFTDAVPEAGQAFIGRLLSRDPAQRYATAGDVLADLARMKDGEPLAPLKGGVAPVEDFDATLLVSDAQRVEAILKAQVPPAVTEKPPETAAIPRSALKPGSSAALHATPASSSPKQPAVRFGSGTAVGIPTVPASNVRSSSGLAPRSGFQPAVGAGASARHRSVGAPQVFGKLETQVNSTIPQSDKERQGDELFRKNQLKQAILLWKAAIEDNHDYAGLRAKIELGQRDLRKHEYEVALNEARWNLDSGQFVTAAARGQEAFDLADSDAQRAAARQILEEAKAKDAGIERNRATQRVVLLLVLGVAVLGVLVWVVVTKLL